MDTQAYAVVWDGRKDGPGSAYLTLAPEPAPVAAVATTDRQTVSARVLAALRVQAMTSTALAAHLGVTSSVVQQVLWMLRQHERVVIVARQPLDPHGRHFGRRAEYVYGLAGEA